MLKIYRLFMAVALCGAGAVAARPAPPPLEAYGQLPAMEHPKLSPNGERYALVAVVGETRELLVMDQAGKVLIQAPLGKTPLRRLDWGGDTYLIVTCSTVSDFGPRYGSLHNVQHTFVINTDTKKSFWVFDHDSHTNLGTWGFNGAYAVKGRWYGYFEGLSVVSGQLNSGHPDLYKVDLETGDKDMVAIHPKEGQRRLWLVGPGGEIAAHTDYDPDHGRWRLYSDHDLRNPLVDQPAPLGEYVLTGFGRSPGTLLYTHQEDTGEIAITEVSVDGVPTPILQDEPVAGLITNATGLLIGVKLKGDEEHSLLFDKALEAKLLAARKAFPAGVHMRLVSWTNDFNRMIVYTNSDTDSGDYWMVDLKTHRADPIGYPYLKVDEASVGPRSVMDYTAADGMALHAILTLPPSREAKGLPVVVMPHGGPAARDDLSFDWWAEAFASRGYAVIQPNFRGSTGYSGAYFKAGAGEWGRKMETDVSDALAALAAKGVVDPKRACIVGASYGGYAALAGITVQQGLYRCAVSWGGVSDLQGMMATDENHGAYNAVRRYWKTYIGTGRALHDVSPLDLADKADAPVLVMWGDDDTVVPPDQSQRMIHALRSAQKPVDQLELKNEDHWLSHEATRTAMLKASVAFVEKYDPAD